MIEPTNLNALLDTQPWATLRAIAIHYAQQGQDALATSYDCMAEKQMMPHLSGGKWYWKLWEDGPVTSHEVFDDAFTRLAGYRGGFWCQYDSLSDAYHQLAIALAQMYEDQQP